MKQMKDRIWNEVLLRVIDNPNEMLYYGDKM